MGPQLRAQARPCSQRLRTFPAEPRGQWECAVGGNRTRAPAGSRQPAAQPGPVIPHVSVRCVGPEARNRSSGGGSRPGVESELPQLPAAWLSKALLSAPRLPTCGPRGGGNSGRPSRDHGGWGMAQVCPPPPGPAGLPAEEEAPPIGRDAPPGPGPGPGRHGDWHTRSQHSTRGHPSWPRGGSWAQWAQRPLRLTLHRKHRPKGQGRSPPLAPTALSAAPRLGGGWLSWGRRPGAQPAAAGRPGGRKSDVCPCL